MKAQQNTITLLLDSLEPEAITLVQAIEAKPATTQNHYGDYMVVLGQAPRTTALLLGVAMVRNGGNKQGIFAALKALGHCP